LIWINASRDCPRIKSPTLAFACYCPPMAPSAKELRVTADALSRNARALREASDAARDRSAILKDKARTTSDAAAKSFQQAEAAEKRQTDR
jgi:hypothetical protein